MRCDLIEKEDSLSKLALNYLQESNVDKPKYPNAHYKLHPWNNNRFQRFIICVLIFGQPESKLSNTYYLLEILPVTCYRINKVLLSMLFSLISVPEDQKCLYFKRGSSRFYSPLLLALFQHWNFQARWN